MKIVDKRNKNTSLVTFRDVNVGNVFEINDILYLKIQPFFETKNAYSIANKILTTFGDYTKVKPINSELHILS